MSTFRTSLGHSRLSLAAILLLSVSSTLHADLDVAVEITPNNPEPGERVQVRLTVTNPGATVESDVSIEVPFPAQFSEMADGFFSDGGDCDSVVGSAGSCENGEVAMWSFGSLTAGTGRTVVMAPAVDSGLTGGETIAIEPDVLRSGVLATSGLGEAEVVAERTFDLRADADQEPVAPDDVLTYELTFGNRGSTATTNTELRFTLPAGTTFVSADGGGSPEGNDVVWDLGTLNPGVGGRRSVSLTVDSASYAFGDVVVVDAAQISGDANLVPQVVQQVVTTRVESLTQLALEMDTDASPARQGEFSPIHLTVTNRTGAAMSDVRVELFVPGGIVDIPDLRLSDGGDCTSVVGSAGTCASGERAFWDIGTLAPATGKTVAIVPAPDNGALDGQALTFVARADSSDTTVRWERRSLFLDADRALELQVDVDQEPVVPDDVLTYELTFGNRSGTATTNAELRFPLPTGTTFVAADGGGSLIGNDVVWDLGVLNPGVGGRRSVSLTVDSANYAFGDIVTVDAAQISGDANFETLAARQVATTRVENLPQLALEMDTDAAPARQGEFSPIHLTVTNRTGVVMSDVRVELFIPAGLFDIPDLRLSDSGDCTSIVGSAGSCAGGETASWDIGTLAPATGKTVAILPAPNTGALNGQALSFVARAGSNSTTERWERRSLYLDADRALELQVDADQEPVVPDAVLTYELTFGNRSGTATTNSELRFPLPAGTSFVAADGGGSLEGNDVVWDLSVLNPGVGGRRSVSLTVDSANYADGDIVSVDAAQISGDANFETLVVRQVATTRVESLPQLAFELDTDASPARQGEFSPIHLTVTNRTGAVMSDVRVELFMPSGLSDIPDLRLSDDGDCTSIVGGAGSCAGGELAFWDIDTLGPGGGKTVTVTPATRMDSLDGQVLTFVSRASANSTAVRWERRSLYLDADRALDIQVDADEELVAPLDVVAYEITIGNRSQITTTNTELRFPLPPGTSLVSADGGASLEGNDIVWVLGRLEPGETGIRNATLQLNDPPTGGEIVVAERVSLQSDETPPLLTNRMVRVKADGTASLDLELDPVFNLQGDSFISELTVSNTSGVQLSDVVLELFYPSFLADLPDSEISDGGDCTSITGGAGSCASGETVIWNLDTLDANSSSIVSIPPTVTSGTGEPNTGTLINFFARLRTPSAEGGFETRTLIVGNPEVLDIPEIEVQGNDITILDGDDSPSTTDGTDFGGALADAESVDQTFTIFNTGIVELLLSGNPAVQITGSGSDAFSVIQQPAAVINSDSDSSFVVRFEPCVIGNFAATVSIINNDIDESPYTFDILGEGQGSSTEFIFGDDFELSCEDKLENPAR